VSKALRRIVLLIEYVAGQPKPRLYVRTPTVEMRIHHIVGMGRGEDYIETISSKQLLGTGADDQSKGEHATFQC
jgi:hypothetical protein